LLFLFSESAKKTKTTTIGLIVQLIPDQLLRTKGQGPRTKRAE
jgi:hypothetical protein